MTGSNMTYDIRTAELAKRTLVKLTGVPLSVWEQYLGKEKEYRYIDDLVADVIDTHGSLPKNYRAFEFIYFHITTSANEGASFRKHGVLDLKQAYLCDGSELRTFLENHDIHIDLDDEILKYQDREFDISFGDAPIHGSEAYKRWSIGRKLFSDFTTCGFLSVWKKSPYGGYVHYRPEVLMDIDNLLGLNLSKEWAQTHEPYEVVAKVSGEKIIFCGDEDQSDEEKVISYLTKAYNTAFGEPGEEVLLMKDDVQIPASDIIEIKPLKYWRQTS